MGMTKANDYNSGSQLSKCIRIETVAAIECLEAFAEHRKSWGNRGIEIFKLYVEQMFGRKR